MRRRYLVTYDVSDDKRRTKIFEHLQDFGDWVQYSVFFCELTDQEKVRMRRILREHAHHTEDQVLILDLGHARHPISETLEVIGRAYEPPVRSFIV